MSAEVKIRCNIRLCGGSYLTLDTKFNLGGKTNVSSINEAIA